LHVQITKDLTNASYKRINIKVNGTKSVSRQANYSASLTSDTPG